MSNQGHTDGFDRFQLHGSLSKAIEAMGFTSPTPIQERAIPDAMQGRDVLGLAQTGTGKTAAFGLAILHRLMTGNTRGTRALILAPTRELVTQINAELRTLAKFTPLKTVTIFGGVGAGAQIQALRRKPDVIVACPGRLLDLYRQKQVVLSHIETFILDEADQMFDMGFLPDIKKIIATLPKTRQNLMFSATMPGDIRRLADQILVDPLTVEVDFKGPAKTVKHALYPVDDKRKAELLQTLLSKPEVTTSIVFTKTKHRAKKLADQLDRSGTRATSLQGNMSQAQRDRAMRDFRKGKFSVLVATDIASRGIDVAGVSHVINYDVPSTAEAYTHRIGRTGRAEQNGEAFTLVTTADRRMVRDIERTLGQPIERRAEAGFEIDFERGAPGGPGPGRTNKPRPGGGRGGPANRNFRGKPGGGDRNGRPGGNKPRQHRKGQGRPNATAS